MEAMVIKQYRKVPVVIAAARLTTENRSEVVQWCGGYALEGHTGLDIRTLEGVIHASPGDYIIRGIAGEFYPCKSEIFNESYEAVIDKEGKD